MRVRNILAGFVLALLAIGAFLTTPVGAQQIMRIYGTVSGAPIALLATAGGVLRVSLDSGTVTSLTFPASTCAAPAINETGALTTGIAFTATPSILECVSGTARGTWAATGLTTVVPIFVTPLSRSAYAFQVFDPTDASSAIELYVGGTGNGNLYINDGSGAAVYSFESAGIATLGAAAGSSYLQVQRSGQIMTINPDHSLTDTYSAVATNNNIGMKFILDDGTTSLVVLQMETDGRISAPSAGGSFALGGVKFAINTAPTIASGGCTSPAVTWSNGTAAFLITIGTSCTGVKTVVLTMPASAHLWACSGDNSTSDAAQQTNVIVGRATSTTAVTLTSYDRVLGVQEDFTASDTYLVQCSAG